VFLGLPLGVVIVAVGIGTLAVVIVGWFATLFTGRTPKTTRSLVTIFLRLTIRWRAYTFLMSDRFPAFEFDETRDDVIHLAVPDPTPMTRPVVFFRLLLAFPALVLAAILELGILVVQVVMWFVVLITGSLPEPVHDAYKAVFRYSARAAAYGFLLVPTYPWGPFGDVAAVSGMVGQQPAVEAPAGWPEAQRSGPRPWDIVLSHAAKWVVVVAIALGIPSYVGLQVIRTLSSPTYQRSQLIQANNALVLQIGQYETTRRACHSRVPCLESNDHTIAEQLTAFATTLLRYSHSGIDPATQATARSDAVNLAGLFYLAANAGPTMADYQRTNDEAHVKDAELALQRALDQLQHALNNA